MPLPNVSSDHLLTSWSHQYAHPAATASLQADADWGGLLARARNEHRAVALRAAGLSWTDITMARDGLVVSTTGLDAILGFDRETGIFRAQAGATLRAVVDHVLPHGWIPACLPGSLDVTLGGALACNVHGKDAHRHGTFCEQVLSLRLLDGAGREHGIERRRDADMLEAVAGSMGLLGLITEITLQLQPRPGGTLGHRQERIDGAADLVAFADRGRNHDFVWGWLDPVSAMRGRVHALAHCCDWSGPGAQPDRPSGNAGARLGLPGRLLAPFLRAGPARHAVSLAHRLRRNIRPAAPRPRDWREVLFPHEQMTGLRELFSRQGFVELQAVIPAGSLSSLFAAIGGLPRNDRLPAFLVSFKLHRASQGMLAFSGDGIGLSFVSTVFDQEPARLANGLEVLRGLTLAAGGRINLHRDGNLGREFVAAMYPDLDRFLAIKRRLDPDNLLRSAFWDRLVGAGPDA